MSAAFKILVAEGDRWLERSTNTYQGGGDFSVAACEAAIASAFFARAAIEKPDTFGQLVTASQLQAAAQKAKEQQGGTNGAPAKRAGARRPKAAQ